MRAKILKASLALVTATGASVLPMKNVSAAGKVSVVFCKKNGQEIYFKDGFIAKADKNFCKHKDVSSNEYLKIKFSVEGSKND